MLLELWCWRRLLRVPWTARRSSQSILKEISSGCSLEGLMLATWCEELTHLKRPCCWGRLKMSREGDDRGWDGWMASPTQWTWVWVNSGNWWWTGRPGVLQSMGSQSWTWLSDWTELCVSPYSKHLRCPGEQNKHPCPGGMRWGKGVRKTDTQTDTIHR